jgi:spermidine/putrescine-binding protein
MTKDICSAALTRRGVLKLTAGAAGVGVVARLMSTSALAAVAGELQVMAWEGYDLNKELQGWRDERGVVLQSTSITSQDDVQAKFMTGNAAPFDLAEFNQAYSDLYISQLKIVKPLDRDQIPNYNAENLFPMFYNKPTWEFGGKLWGVPWIWGFNTALYNPEKMRKPAAYKDFLAPELKGKIAIVDDTITTWPVAARVAGLGAKYPNLTKDELAATFAEFTKYRSQARMIALNMGDVSSALGSGEIYGVLCADPAIIGMSKDLGVGIDMAIPSEGVVIWVDAWFMPISVDNPETAMAYINQAISPEVQAKICMVLNQAPVSKKALDFMDEAARKRIDYDNIEKIFAAGLPGIPPLQSTEFATYDDWVAAWQEFKAGM